MSMFDFSDPRVMTSDELLVVDHVPASLAIVGGGVIGCEFASVFARLGSKVTVIEMLDQLLPGEDKRTGRTLQAASAKAGIGVIVKAGVENVEPGGSSGVKLRLAGGLEVVAEAVLVAVGRRPVSSGLGYEEVGVEVGPERLRRHRRHDAHANRWSVRSRRWPERRCSAHWASTARSPPKRGDRLERPWDRRVVPSCVFSSPEVGSFRSERGQGGGRGPRDTGGARVFNGNSKA